MKFAALALVLGLAACGGGQGTTAMNVTFAPNPPQKGSDQIIVSLKDRAGNPIKGAHVTIATSMPSMSMAGPQLTPKDNGDGTYTAQAQLDFATDWKFDVEANAGGETQQITVTASVK